MAGDPALPARFTSRAGRERFRLSFDEDAPAYDATRPVPPLEVFDDLVQLTGLHPGDHVLEIGPDTGQATRPLLQRELVDRIRRRIEELGGAITAHLLAILTVARV